MFEGKANLSGASLLGKLLWPYPQILDWAVNACKGELLWLITNIRKLRTYFIYIGPCGQYYKTF